MPRLNISVRHNLTQEEALQRIKGLLGEVRQQYGDKISDLKEDWTRNICGFSFKAMGFAVSGTLIVGPWEVELSGNLPFAASLFKGQIESAIRQRAEELLA